MNNNTEETTVTVTAKPAKAKKMNAKVNNKNKGANKIKAAAKTISTRAQVAAANGKTLGRSKGAVSCISVSATDLAKLVNAMPNLMIPVHRKTASVFGLTGIPFSATIANINEITKGFKTQNSNVSVINLNETVEENAVAA